MTVNARSEDDLDYDTILQKVAKASGKRRWLHIPCNSFGRIIDW